MLEKLFTSKTRVKLLELFLLNPTKSFHLRKLARMTNLSVPSVRKELERLTETGLLGQTSEGNMLVFQINTNSPLYDGLKSMFFKDYGIYVRTTKNVMDSFDALRIKDSLVKETKLAPKQAEQISKDVEAEIRRLGLNFLSAPLVRELVNRELIVHGLEKERKLYTRIGMPVYDVTQMIEKGSKENANLQYNPETVHKLMADQIAKEYTLVKVLPVELSDAHMRGQIHIHDLDYFAMRPFCFSHDVRYFLKNGFKADGVGNHTAVAAPAKKAEVAFLHAAKALAAAQTNCAGGQGFSYFNTFLSPYVTGMDDKKLRQMAQMFIYEMSQMYVARGGQTVFSSIDCDMHVPKQFLDIPAVLPGGVVKDSTTYADFDNETNKLFNAFVDVYLEGDAIGKPFNFPKFEVQLHPKEMNGKNEETLLKVSELAAKFGTPYYIINQPYMPEFSCYQCCAFLMPLGDANTQDDIVGGTLRGGALQVVTINLPQLAYEAKGDDGKLYELLKDRMDKAKEAHILKKKIISKNLKNGLLPFMAQSVNDKGDRYLEPDKQSFIIGLVGMNEMLKAHTGSELHESTDSWKFGLKFMKDIKDIVADFRKETGMNFSLARTPAESCSYRLAQIDMKAYPDQAVYQGSGNSAYYTNSFHVSPFADVPMFDRLDLEGAFHPLTDGGAMSHVWLGEANPNTEGIYELTKRIAQKTAIQYFAFTKDLTVCSDCNFTSGGLSNTCSNCNSTKVDWWSRITGYYQNVGGWNKGKLAELSERRRYGLAAGAQTSTVEKDVDAKLRKMG
ncbi:MAG: anaerobic ribonucleoside-triphosphate reductase [archaeon]